MKPPLRPLISLPVIALIIGAIGCSSSATSPPSPSPSSGATIQGTVQTAATGSSAELSAFSTAGGIKVTVVGTSLSTTTDGSGRFVLQGVAGGTPPFAFRGKGTAGPTELGGLVEAQTLPSPGAVPAPPP